MEAGSENIDVMKFINVKGSAENITPHKIAVVAFIREYGLLKIEGKIILIASFSIGSYKKFFIL